MAWTIKFDKRALKELKKLGKPDQTRIINFLEDRIISADDPRQYGAPLRAEFSGYWKYRVGDCRVIARILDKELVVMVVRIGHRRRVYEDVPA